jgi:hypothetical protein
MIADLTLLIMKPTDCDQDLNAKLRSKQARRDCKNGMKVNFRPSK